MLKLFVHSALMAAVSTLSHSFCSAMDTSGAATQEGDSGHCPQARALTVMSFLIWAQGGVHTVSELLELHETFWYFLFP